MADMVYLIKRVNSLAAFRKLYKESKEQLKVSKEVTGRYLLTGLNLNSESVFCCWAHIEDGKVVSVE